MLLLKQMAILFLIMLIGFFCRKWKLMNDAGAKVISGIVVNVANPALILSAGINKESTIQGLDLLKTMGLAVGMFAVLMGLAFLLPKLLRAPKRDVGGYQVMTIFSNIGFMGFPVIRAAYGAEALLYASLFLIPFNVLIYTFGIHAMKAGGESVSSIEERAKEEGASGKRSAIPWGKIFNVGVIACIVTMILYITRLPVPTVIESTANTLSELTAPLSMLVIGDSMANMNFKSLFTDVRLLLFTGIKLLVIPIAGMALLNLFGLDPMLSGVCLIMLATPVGSMTAMLAQQYGGNYELTSKGVALTTVLSVGTIPLVSAIVGLFAAGV